MLQCHEFVLRGKHLSAGPHCAFCSGYIMDDTSERISCTRTVLGRQWKNVRHPLE